MFDMGFFELVVIALVGLFVIGPERLPTTIRTIALWVGRIKRSLLETRREIEQQLGTDEIRRELQNEQVMRNWQKMKETRAELEAKLKSWETGEVLEHKTGDQTDEAETVDPDDHAAHAAASSTAVDDSTAADTSNPAADIRSFPPPSTPQVPAEKAVPPETTTKN